MLNVPPETRLAWDSNDTPRSERFGDTYYSAEDGLAEARHVFLAGNQLPDAWARRAHFHVAELGFGTGFNVLAARELWRRTRAPNAVLSVTSFERYPLRAAQIARALARWPEIAALAAELTGIWTPKGGVFDFGDTRLQVVVADARAAVPGWNGIADAWFLDGFAPARNAEMWGPSSCVRSSSTRSRAARQQRSPPPARCAGHSRKQGSWSKSAPALGRSAT